MRSRSLLLGLLWFLSACADSDLLLPPSSVPIDQQLRQLLAQWNVVPIGPIQQQGPARVELGRLLFFDKILSGNRDVACATCHHPLHHGADGLHLAIGTGGTGLGPARVLGPGRQFVPRNSPSLLNQGLRAEYLFWDGRLSGHGSGPFTAPPGVVLPAGLSNIVAAQAMLPVLNRIEMRGERGDRDVFGNPNELAEYEDSEYPLIWDAIMRRLLAIPEYADRFRRSFPEVPASSLKFSHAAEAIAAFVIQEFARYGSPFDRYLDRDDAALSAEAKRGALLFFGRAGCGFCHNGPLLGGGSFANVGIPQFGPGVGSGAPLDLGRAEVLKLQFPGAAGSYRFAFRVPPLRNVELTAPYMHNGAYPTLEAVVRHYNDVSAALRNYDLNQLPPELRATYHGGEEVIGDILARLHPAVSRRLNLTEEERGALVAFLKSLTDPRARDLSALIPASVPSGLPLP
ncbi:MAG: methylamine utilization protein MauG [Gemmatimonadales bacterium]|nr:MAG: methylamine utilization protein MauG [Gemmatimonadales bacterium]